MNYLKCFLILIILSSGISSCNSCNKKKRTLRHDNLYSFLNVKEENKIQRQFNTLSDSISFYFEQKNSEKFIKWTAIYLDYSNSIPVFFIDSYFKALKRRIEREGVEPYLSICIDLGRRWSALKTPQAGMKYQYLIEKFSQTQLIPKGNTIILRKGGDEQVSPKDYYRAYSDNVGIAVSALLFSDFGKNLTTSMDPELAIFFELIGYAANCTSCDINGRSEHPFEFSIAGPDFYKPDFKKTNITSISEVSSECEALNFGFLNGMTEISARNLEQSSCDIKKKGYFSSNADLEQCYQEYRNHVENYNPQFQQMREVKEYTDCWEQSVGPLKPSKYFEDMSAYLTDVTSGTGSSTSCTFGFCTDTEVEKNDKGLPTKVTKTRHPLGNNEYYTQTIVDYNNNTTTTSSNVPNHQHSSTYVGTSGTDDDNLISSYASTNHDNGTTVTRTFHKNDNGSTIHAQKIQTSSGNTYYKVTTNKGTEEEETTYGMENENGSVEITKEEFEKAEKEHVPTINPGPEGPFTPCDMALNTIDITKGVEDIIPLINLGPDGTPLIDIKLQEFLDCLQPDETNNICHTHLMCTDEPGVDQCTCQRYNFNYGQFADRDCNELIQCPGNTQITDCGCILPNGGGVFPGIQISDTIGRRDFPIRMEMREIVQLFNSIGKTLKK